MNEQCEIKKNANGTYDFPARDDGIYQVKIEQSVIVSIENVTGNNASSGVIAFDARKKMQF